MKRCENCGWDNPNVNTICVSCGATLPASEGYVVDENSGKVEFARASFRLPVKYKNGGLIAWAIVALLLSTLPGAVALTFAVEINNSYTFDEQMRKVSLAKGWCIVGTVLGLFGMVIFLLR